LGVLPIALPTLRPPQPAAAHAPAERGEGGCVNLMDAAGNQFGGVDGDAIRQQDREDECDRLHYEVPDNNFRQHVGRIVTRSAMEFIVADELALREGSERLF
jgi:hypothetical protein